ncbi:MAG: periplasmic heavy metal sensor [Hyphomonadaceae bacterium]
MSEARSRFPLRTAFFISLALNLLLIGAAVGGYAAGLRFERASHHGERTERPRGGYMRAISRSERVEMRRDLRESWAQTQPLRQAARTARENVIAAAAAEPFDEAAMRAALAQMREADSALQGAWQDVMVRSLARLPAEERREAVRAFVRDRMFARLRRGERRREEDGPPPLPPPDENEAPPPVP